MNETGYLPWKNPDSTIDLICLGCFKTVAQSRVQAILAAAETEHKCNPLDLALLPSVPLSGAGEETRWP